MKIIGKFNSGEFFGDKCKINFRVEDSIEVHKRIYGMLTNGLFITFGEAVQFKGYLDGETSKKAGMTMFIVLMIEPDKMSRLFSFKGQIISIEITKDSDSIITRSIANIAFITKLKGMMHTMGSQLGYMDSEMQKTLKQSFCDKSGITTFDLKRANNEHLELFKEHIIETAQGVGIDFTEGISDNIPSLDSYLKMRRQMKKCCVCEFKYTTIKGVYPLCEKHKEELDKLGEAKFKKKYTLGQ